MKLKFVTFGFCYRKLKDGTYKRVQNTATLGTFKKVQFEDLKLYVRKFEKVWVEV